MKLIYCFLILTTSIYVESNDRFNGPTPYPRPGEGYSTDGSKYLPPELHTSIPYIPMKNMNLQYQYLPATVTKAPMRFPSPYPLIISTTLMPFEDEDNESSKRPSHHTTQHHHSTQNHHPSQNNPQQNRHPQQNYNPEQGHQPSQNQQSSQTYQPPQHQQPSQSHQQIQKNNRTEKNINYRSENREFNPPRPTYHQPIYRIDSKTPMGFSRNVPTATPRSFIIEAEDTKRSDALDQYKISFQGPQYLPAPGLQNVFISSTTEPAIPILRLSNEMDLDGSFSYEALGADQTHYVQHSRMENLGTDKEEQVVEGSYSYVGDNGQTYTVHYIADSNGFRASGDHLPVAPPIPEIIQRAVQYNLAEEAKKPPHLKSWQNEEYELSDNDKYQTYTSKGLFTGRTPESFSFAFSQEPQDPLNNLLSAASSQVPKKVDYSNEKPKSNHNIGPISPQVTFMATQGAHNPPVNPQQQRFTNERSTMPQLVNYDKNNQDNEENNKALWRWQYGINANNIQHTSENPKNSISRSFGEDDDIIVNFNNMTPDQYTSMLKSELEPQVRVEKDETSQDKYDEFRNIPVLNENENLSVTTQMSPKNNKNATDSWYNMDDVVMYTNFNDYGTFKQDENQQQVNEKTSLPQNNSSYVQNNMDNKENADWSNTNSAETQATEYPESDLNVESIMFQDFVISEKPETQTNAPSTTTEVLQMLQNNIFLRNILQLDKFKQIERNKIKDDTPKFLPKIKPVHTHVKPNPFLEIQGIRKPLDAGEILRYITAGNSFDSIKTKRSNKKVAQSPKFPKTLSEEEEVKFNESLKPMESYNYEPRGTRAPLKKYKVLQRNRNVATGDKQAYDDDYIRPVVRTLQSSLPPLGRAGPAMKSYLPPIYV